METVRAVLMLSLVTGAALSTRNVASGPATERLVTGTATPRGTVLVAGDGGAHYRLQGGSMIDISAGAEFSFEPSVRVPLGEPGQREALVRVLRVSRGAIEVSVSNATREPTAVIVRGPGKMNSVVKHGLSTFIATGDGSTIACRSGDALVGVGDDWRLLKAGFARTLSREDPRAAPRAIIAAPAAAVDHGLVFVRDSGEGGQAEVSWTPVTGATGYEVRVTRADNRESTLASRETTTLTSATLRALSPGMYSFVVAAVDRFGVAGAPSKPKTLRVAGLELPEGASVGEDGAIVLGKQQRVRLLAADGLEVSYGAARVFGAAPNTLGLSNNEPVLVRLRAPGATEETVIRLEPRGLRARVRIGPKTALWPGDSVDISVDLYDALGRSSAEGNNVKPMVTVNLEAVKLQWHRVGRTLRATVPPPTSSGPWIVRAEVRDERGDPIGRDFLEIAKRGVQRTVAAQ